MTLLEVRNLRVRFDTPRGPVQAVDDVSLSVDAGETVALVGESGSGKSITGLSILGLAPSIGGVVETGEVWFEGKNLLAASSRELRAMRGRDIALVMQDAHGALNPLLPLGEQLAEVLWVHEQSDSRSARDRAASALHEVGMPDPRGRLDAYPHELSGGMRQRALIAMALIARPKLIIADEPTSALDVTLQVQVLELFAKIQRERGTALLLISHDVAVVAALAKRVEVMYAGRVVESAATRELLAEPWHPYTRALLSAVPSFDGARAARLPTLPAPSLDVAIAGCPFAPRCEFARERCQRERPELSGLLRGQRDLAFTAARRAACFEKERVIAAPTEVAS